MRDVSTEVAALQKDPVFVPQPDGSFRSDPNALVPGGGLWKFGWTILDKSAADGFTYHQQPFDFANDQTARNAAAGRLFAVEDPDSTTRLLYVWLPNMLIRRLEAGTLQAPLNFHVLFHPLTYEEHYRRTSYWNGRDPQTKDAVFVHLGMRYACRDFATVAHHVMAVSARSPNVAIVVPVAERDNNFSDMVSGSAMVRKLYGLYDFLARTVRPASAPQFDKIGKVMVSGYSRSGDRLVRLFADRTGQNAPFFDSHLSQVNAFDINLGNNDDERLPPFRNLWRGIQQWSASTPNARAFLYTVYRSHYNEVVAQPIYSGQSWSNRTEVAMNSVAWSDKAAKSAKGAVRDIAFEAYDADGRFGVVNLPVSFFQYYLTNHDGKGHDVDVGNSLRGWHDGTYRTGGSHGHGLFLRGMMSHAIARADPVFFAAR